MFIYKKQLQFPIKIANTNPKLAGIIISQYGGPNGKWFQAKIKCHPEIKEEVFVFSQASSLCSKWHVFKLVKR